VRRQKKVAMIFGSRDYLNEANFFRTRLGRTTLNSRSNHGAT
jgi:hypothetical protein